MTWIRTTTAMLLALGCLTLGVGCGDEEDEAKVMKVQTAQGEVELRYLDLVVGKGETVKKGDMIVFHYAGWTQAGSKLPGSRDHGKPANLVIGVWRPGEPGLIGWHEGIPGMKVGGKRKLFIPPELAYKDKGSPDQMVKPNAKVVYEIEVLKIITNPDERDPDFFNSD
jgi:peptidylprolyl isomerase